MVKKWIAAGIGVLIGLGLGSGAGAGELTALMCKDKVIAAAELIEKEGRDAFAKIKDPNGEFRFGDGKGYIWIQNLDGIMVMHPIASHLDGKGLYNLQDEDGVYFFMAFNEMAEEYGAGWVGYRWPKPGQKESSPKISYVKLAEHGDESFVVGAGMYDVTTDQIKAQFPDDPLYGD